MVVDGVTVYYDINDFGGADFGLLPWTLEVHSDDFAPGVVVQEYINGNWVPIPGAAAGDLDQQHTVRVTFDSTTGIVRAVVSGLQPGNFTWKLWQ